MSRQQVLNAYEQALRFKPGDSKIERRCAEVAMEMGLEQINDAKTHLANLLGNTAQGWTMAGESELEEMLGDCHARESKFEEAETDYERSDQGRFFPRFRLRQAGTADAERSSKGIPRRPQADRGRQSS